MREAFLVDAVRTPVGKFGGALSAVRPDDLLAGVLRSLVERSGLEGGAVEEVIAGCTNQAGEDNRNVARMSLLLAGLPISVPGSTVNRLCASGLDAVVQAARAVMVGEGDVLIAGGVESMTRAPWVMAKPESLPPRGVPELVDSSFGWRFVNPKLAAMHPPLAMGETAENLVEKYDISREEQDAFSLRSHERAVAAWDAGEFDAETVAVDVPGRRGAVTVFDRDEGPRADTSMESLAKLRPVFRQGGSVTAGNSSSLNDGAAAVLVASAAAVDRYGLEPAARIVASGVVGADPSFMGIAPVGATEVALRRAGWTLDDVDTVELNEAFAGQSLAVLRELPLDQAIVNPQGGAIAIGHPLGSTGARLTATLLHRLRRDTTLRRGLVTLCVGVGQGQSLLVESVR
ncbi:MAG: acetyl-CoA C-acyltransferase [Nitriliruptorales bacterium]|nr:acetyl-CoA C-acyltransferase [Nitriliruptorales bacterium]